jgi:hypothetical protein
LEQKFKELRILTSAFMLGITMFIVIAFTVTHINNYAFNLSLNPSMAYVGIGLFIIFVSVSFLLFKKDSAACTETDENLKINLYRAAIVKQFAFIEVPGLFNVIAYFLGGNVISLVIAILCVVLMFTQRPSESRFSQFGM